MVGHTIEGVEVADDELLLKHVPKEAFESGLQGAKVTGIGRKGKFWWISLQDRQTLCGHLGMAGWVRELGQPTARLKEHGSKPLDDDQGRPRFLKMMLTSEEGRRAAMTDGRRLARLWLAEDPLKSKPIARLGPDVYTDPWDPAELHRLLKQRSAPMKALLLNQEIFAGVGNWLADEALYQAGISPKRPGSEVSREELKTMLERLHEVLQAAIDAKAEETLFPKHWMFHCRWGGKRGSDTIDGHQIVREEVGGRTTAWVPELQR